MTTAIFPVSLSKHKALRWANFDSYAFAAKDTVCPVVMSEMPKAASDLPLAFIQRGEDFIPVAVLGLTADTNAFVGADGLWQQAYVPAQYRGYPFLIAPTEDGEQLFCVNEASELVGPDKEQPFFNDEDELSPELKRIFDFWVQVEANRVQTHKFAAALKEFDLLEPWEITVENEEGGSYQVTGLFRINEERLNSLSDEDFLAVRASGVLPMVYCQLFSMQHLGTVAQKAAQRIQEEQAHVTLSDAGGELDLEFLNQDSTINFGGV